MENRRAYRVVFERGFAVNMMAIDGTWRRPCTMEDIADTGARLIIDGSIEGLALKEFFLTLSTMAKSIPALRISLGQWQSGWRLFRQSVRQKEEILKARRDSSARQRSRRQLSLSKSIKV